MNIEITISQYLLIKISQKIYYSLLEILSGTNRYTTMQLKCEV